MAFITYTLHCSSLTTIIHKSEINLTNFYKTCHKLDKFFTIQKLCKIEIRTSTLQSYNVRQSWKTLHQILTKKKRKTLHHRSYWTFITCLTSSELALNSNLIGTTKYLYVILLRGKTKCAWAVLKTGTPAATTRQCKVTYG